MDGGTTLARTWTWWYAADSLESKQVTTFTETVVERLLVSVRGSNKAIAAAKGGAHITDVEYPGSALGDPYPLNIKAVRD